MHFQSDWFDICVGPLEYKLRQLKMKMSFCLCKFTISQSIFPLSEIILTISICGSVASSYEECCYAAAVVVLPECMPILFRLSCRDCLLVPWLTGREGNVKLMYEERPVI